MTDDPLFRSAHAALTFALNYSHGSVQPSALAHMAGGPRTGNGLGGLDGAAQAGMIQREMQELSAPHRAMLTARYSAQRMPCACRQPCCKGYRQSEQWSAAVDALTEHVLIAGLTGTVSHYRLRRALVERYFGASQSFTTIAAECGVNRDTASLYHGRVVEHFRREGQRALAEIEGRLKAAGVVE